jgi:hypothetical protein
MVVGEDPQYYLWPVSVAQAVTDMLVHCHFGMLHANCLPQTHKNFLVTCLLHYSNFTHDLAKHDDQLDKESLPTTFSLSGDPARNSQLSVMVTFIYFGKCASNSQLLELTTDHHAVITLFLYHHS